MSWPTTIVNGLQTAIQANASFTTADVFEGRERKDSPMPDADGSQVFVDVMKVENDPQPDGLKFKKFTVELVVAFLEAGRGPIDDETIDVVVRTRADLDEALRTAVWTANPWQANKIHEDAYQLEYIDSDLEYVPEDREILDRGESIRRFKQRWLIYVNEN